MGGRVEEEQLLGVEERSDAGLAASVLASCAWAHPDCDWPPCMAVQGAYEVGILVAETQAEDDQSLPAASQLVQPEGEIVVLIDDAGLLV